MKFEVEFRRSYKVIIEAENKNHAEEIASVMDDEEIEKGEIENFDIHNIKAAE